MISLRKLIPAAVAAIALAAPVAAESLRVLNRSGYTMTGIWMNTAQNNNWGPERLRGARVGNGGYYQANIPNPIGCMYDLRVQWSDGQMSEFYGIDICRYDSYTINP
jgi:hypothetical protein